MKRLLATAAAWSAGRWRKAAIAAALTALTFGAIESYAAPGRYVELDEFLQSALGTVPPNAETLFVDPALRERLESVLGHRFPRLRLKYWRSGDTTAWILDEIGKTEPITFGVAIEHGRVKSLQVLEFRESRGWEIRHPFFTNQYSGAGLTARDEVDRPIDGITGATYSVAAVEKVVRAVLICDATVNGTDESPSS